jgi:hypothetical protein
MDPAGPSEQVRGCQSKVIAVCSRAALTFAAKRYRVCDLEMCESSLADMRSGDLSPDSRRPDGRSFAEKADSNLLDVMSLGNKRQHAAWLEHDARGSR